MIQFIALWAMCRFISDEASKLGTAFVIQERLKHAYHFHFKSFYIGVPPFSGAVLYFIRHC